MATERKGGVLGNWQRPIIAPDPRPASDIVLRAPASTLAGLGAMRCPLEAACRADDEAGR